MTDLENPGDVSQKIEQMLCVLDQVSKELAEVRLWALALAAKGKNK